MRVLCCPRPTNDGPANHAHWSMAKNHCVIRDMCPSLMISSRFSSSISPLVYWILHSAAAVFMDLPHAASVVLVASHERRPQAHKLRCP